MSSLLSVCNELKIQIFGKTFKKKCSHRLATWKVVNFPCNWRTDVHLHFYKLEWPLQFFVFVFWKKKLILTSGLLYFAAPIKGITEIAWWKLKCFFQCHVTESSALQQRLKSGQSPLHRPLISSNLIHTPTGQTLKWFQTRTICRPQLIEI